MWLDAVVIDKVGSNGALQTIQLRPKKEDGAIVADLLENIDPSFRDASVVEDIGPLRVYDNDDFRVNYVASLLKNIALGPDGSLFVQYEHFHIPVFHGYYAVIFPRGWRIKQINIYDPYDASSENPLEKRSYKDIDICHSSKSRTSFAQLNMRTIEKRQIFSIGIVAEAAKIENSESFIERVCDEVQIRFTDPRHGSRFNKFLNSSNQLAKATVGGKLPPVNVGMLGPIPNVQTDLMGWLTLLREKIRPAPR